MAGSFEREVHVLNTFSKDRAMVDPRVQSAVANHAGLAYCIRMAATITPTAGGDYFLSVANLAGSGRNMVVVGAMLRAASDEVVVADAAVNGTLTVPLTTNLTVNKLNSAGVAPSTLIDARQGVALAPGGVADILGSIPLEALASNEARIYTFPIAPIVAPGSALRLFAVTGGIAIWVDGIYVYFE